ncbi:hypothetical protein ACFVT8_13930 [Lysinibacillus sp. NPDC058147]|uniref:hypothetical protein n=1 Tax=unclassified Lysinibacillus TaxID=2636778 RepID=UPI0036D799C9
MFLFATPGELFDAIRAAYRREAIFRTSIAAKVMAKAIKSANEEFETNKAKVEMFEMFTERKLEVLQQMAYGLKKKIFLMCFTLVRV